MFMGGLRGRARASVTVLLSIATVAVALTAATPAAADDATPGGDPDAYYAAVAKAAPAGEAAAPEKPVIQPLYDIDSSTYIAGNLVSDAQFFNPNAMTQAQVQSFLNAEVPTCRTGYTCLKSYTTSSENRTADVMCPSGYTAAAGETAAAIIAKVGKSCGISQRVLLALLQKEQSLVTDDWPSATQYAFATGYACPDDPGVGCDPDTTGFFAQVYGAAWQFKRYGNPAGTSNYFTWFPVGKVTNISYSPNAGCGSAPVAIWNKATAALYYYTPYQPNAAAMKDFFGNGDRCSEVGNRNFWGVYSEWFGSTTTGSVPSAKRVAGADRFFTAAAISAAAFPAPTANTLTAFVANGLDFPDALAAAPAAAKAGGPLLLTMPGGVPAATMAELKRLKPKQIIVVGGPAVVTNDVLTQLRTVQAGQSVSRIYGGSRFDTSIQIAKAVFGTSTGANTAYLASGLGFPDALSAGGAAGANGQPVILVNGGLTTADEGTVSALRALHVSTVKIVGGTSIVSPQFESTLRSRGFTVKRVAGSDRFATSTVVNADAFTTATPAAYFASGTTFPDALAGAAWAGVTHSPLLVTQAGCMYAGTAEIALRSKALVTLGGANALGNQVGALAVCQ